MSAYIGGFIGFFKMFLYIINTYLTNPCYLDFFFKCYSSKAASTKSNSINKTFYNNNLKEILSYHSTSPLSQSHANFIIKNKNRNTNIQTAQPSDNLDNYVTNINLKSNKQDKFTVSNNSLDALVLISMQSSIIIWKFVIRY